jgi:hypothetical protein
MRATNNCACCLPAVMTGALLLLSACGVSPQSKSPNGFGMNASNRTTVAFTAPAHSVPSDSAKIDSGASETTGDPNATFRGCWYKTKKNRYQAVEISVGNPGTYPFNALLYHGTTCDPNDYADQFGYGDPLTLGDATYVFWFDAFKNDTNMSALWYLGDQTSKCMVYTTTTPVC